MKGRVASPSPQNPLEARLLQALRDAGLRLTVQRRAICRYLATTKTHPTAQQIYNALKGEFPSLSLATVYNTLDTLVRLGAIHALGNTGDGAIHYDADIEPHVNLACLQCHRVVDLPCEAVAELDRKVAAESGYRILGARLVYYGLCPDCQRAAQQTPSVSVAAHH